MNARKINNIPLPVDYSNINENLTLKCIVFFSVNCMTAYSLASKTVKHLLRFFKPTKRTYSVSRYTNKIVLKISMSFEWRHLFAAQSVITRCFLDKYRAQSNRSLLEKLISGEVTFVCNTKFVPDLSQVRESATSSRTSLKVEIK